MAAKKKKKYILKRSKQMRKQARKQARKKSLRKSRKEKLASLRKGRISGGSKNRKNPGRRKVSGTPDWYDKLPETAKVCNCRGCGALLLAPNQGIEIKNVTLPEVAGKIDGKPYCTGCLEVRQSGVGGVSGGLPSPLDREGDYEGGYGSIAKRFLEEDIDDAGDRRRNPSWYNPSFFKQVFQPHLCAELEESISKYNRAVNTAKNNLERVDAGVHIGRIVGEADRVGRAIALLQKNLREVKKVVQEAKYEARKATFDLPED